MLLRIFKNKCVEDVPRKRYLDHINVGFKSFPFISSEKLILEPLKQVKRTIRDKLNLCIEKII